MTAALAYCVAMLLLAGPVCRARERVRAKGESVPPEWAAIVFGPLVVAAAIGVILFLLVTCPRETLGLRIPPPS